MITGLRGSSKPVFRPGVLSGLGEQPRLAHQWLDSRSAGVMGPLTRRVRWCIAIQMDEREITRR